MDLYETLGLDRDAQPDEIKRAYRKAAARTHPDAGGNADAFADVNRAYMVLYDPAKRARYDALGDADTKPRDDLGPVVSIIVAAFDKAVVEAIQRGVENVDIVALARQSIRKDIAEGEMSNAGLREAVKRTKKVSHRLRFSGNGENFIGRALDEQIARHEANIAGNNERLALLRKAVERLAEYVYYVDAPMTPGWGTASTTGRWA
jgi:DnaJ-class molecular chaperone with C-terminal Zn finger domain